MNVEPVKAQEGIEDAKTFLEEGKIQQAKKIFQKYPENPDARELLGDIASFEKDWETAISYYEDLLQQDPNSGVYNFKLGGALGMKAMEGSKFQAAMLVGDIKKYLNKAAELHPTNPEVRRALVEFYMQIPAIVGGSRSTAQSFASELKNINPIDYLLAQAYIHNYDGETEQARSLIQKAVSLAKNDKSLVVRNYLFYELGERAAKFKIDADAGIAFLQNYIRGYGYKDLKSPAWAYLQMARLQSNKQNKQQALELVEKALSAKSDFPEARKEKARILEM
ncbi:tetratricopeptide repeat protein [Salegentibacter sp. HM20]